VKDTIITQYLKLRLLSSLSPVSSMNPSSSISGETAICGRDPDKRGGVMRQIADLIQKRQQRLAEVDQLPDCPVMSWEFHGFVEAEYREALHTLEAETIEQPGPVGQHETLDQPELMVNHLQPRLP